MKKTLLFILASLFIFIVIYTSQLLNADSIRSYNFTSSNGTFNESIYPSKGEDEDYLLLKFETWKNSNISYKNQKMYRTFKKNYLKFWKWKEYNLYVYKYPYINLRKNSEEKLDKIRSE